MAALWSSGQGEAAAAEARRITCFGTGAIFPLRWSRRRAIYTKPGDGLQQAKEYAQILGLKFAYATNGHGIVEHDFLTGQDNDLDGFPNRRRTLGAAQAQARGSRREDRGASARSVLPLIRQVAPLLPGNRDQPRGAGHPPGQERVSS